MDGRMPDTARAQRALTIEEIAALTRAKPRAGDPLDRRISNIAPLDTAVAADISFLDKPKFLDALAVTRAGACFISPRFEAQAPPGLAVLVTPEPYRTFVAVTRALFPEALRPSSLFGVKGRSKDAHVHASARLEANVTVDPLAVIGADAEIGAGVTIQHALIGDRVIIHPGARIGQDGFGYLPTPQGHQKIPQTRRVIVQDDVEIGANSTIDRGSSRDTIIGEGTKIDNLVQIAHNVTIGRHCLIAGQVGISGSARLGDFVMLGGKVGIADHVTIGNGASLGAQSGVMTDVPAGARWLGSPAQPVRDFMKGVAALRRLAHGKREEKPND